MSRRVDSTLDLKEACVVAAREFIAEHGVEELSLRAVARRLGVSHQAPYKHYPSRDHLLAEVMRRCFRGFAAFLEARVPEADPHDELMSRGLRYLEYAARHPLEYRLMFGTTWPEPAEHVGLVADAVHAFDMLRNVLRRRPGSDAAQADLDAMFIWSTMHGLASLQQGDVMTHLGLSPETRQQVVAHVMSRIETGIGPITDASAVPGDVR